MNFKHGSWINISFILSIGIKVTEMSYLPTIIKTVFHSSNKGLIIYAFSKPLTDGQRYIYSILQGTHSFGATEFEDLRTFKYLFQFSIPIPATFCLVMLDFHVIIWKKFTSWSWWLWMTEIHRPSFNKFQNFFKTLCGLQELSRSWKKWKLDLQRPVAILILTTMYGSKMERSVDISFILHKYSLHMRILNSFCFKNDDKQKLLTEKFKLSFTVFKKCTFNLRTVDHDIRSLSG